MKHLMHPVFIACLFLFTLHQLMQKVWHISLHWADGYLDSLMAMPVLLTVWLAEQKVLFGKPGYFTLTALQVSMATVYLFVIAELFFPAISGKFTSDWRDGLMYVCGSLLFFFTINKSGTRYNTANQYRAVKK